MTEQAQKPKKPSPKAQQLSARLSAVQALYQVIQNKQAIKSVAQEFVDRRLDMEIDGEKLVAPDSNLFKTILYGVDDRLLELETIVMAHFQKGKEEEVNEASKVKVEPLLKSILMCGTYELFSRQEIDSPIIINDYLNVTHAFYDQGEVNLVNAILDAISKVVRE